jgi:nucleotide-binding universal stress UspA family protein
MFEKTVVGTDGSDAEAIAVQRAMEMCKLTGATLHIVSAYRPISLSGVAIASGASAGTFDAEAVKVEMHAVPGDPPTCWWAWRRMSTPI